MVIFSLAGLFAHIILYVAGITGIFLIPLILTEQHPDAPVAVPMRWLYRHFSHDTGFFIYAVVWGVVILGLTYTTKVFDYICKHPKGSDDAPDIVKGRRA